MYCLMYVTYSCNLMTHDACQPNGKSRTTQSRTWFAASVRPFTGCRRQDGSRLLGLTTPGISIPSTSRAAEAGCSDRRCQNCFYCQVVRGVGPTFALVRWRERLIAGRHGEPCYRSLSPTEHKAWVIGHEAGAPRFSWSITLTVYYRKNWNRFTKCCCRINDGLSDPQNHRQIGRTH